MRGVLFLCFTFLLVFSEYSEAAKKTKCEVVAALRNEGVPDSDLRDWLCLVQHESSFQYDVTHTNSDGSVDYGLYQINNYYWCDRGEQKFTACWRINTYGCGVSCNSLLNSDISVSTECAVNIKRCNSFYKWYGWVKNCKDVTGLEYDYSEC